MEMWWSGIELYWFPEGLNYTLFIHYPCFIYASSMEYLYTIYVPATKDELQICRIRDKLTG
jgi:hypothetical protein